MYMKILEDYNPTKKRKVLEVFDDMIAHMESNNQVNPIVTELFLIILPWELWKNSIESFF